MEKKKKQIKYFSFLSLLFVLTFFLFQSGNTYGSDYISPGSNEDPLITKSYLDERLKGNRVTGGFKKIYLQKKQVLELESGTEVIVYRGNGRVKGRDGLLNVSKGLLFLEGDSMVKYNLFLAPSEKCGIIASDSMTIFVAGNYKTRK